MLNTSAWPEIDLDVLTDLHLDPKNVRLETANAQVEADMLEDLFANEHVLNLVEGIAKVGYLTHEVPIVVKRRGKYVVVEGNRRVAALKVIQNPMLVPAFQSRVSQLAKAIPNLASLERIRVKIAPNQTVADQLIAAIHTSNLRRAWTPARQAAFFQTQIDAGRKYSELVSRYPTIDVRPFLFRSYIGNLFKNTKYEDPELADFVKTKAWQRGASTLERIYESKQFLDLTGLKMDSKGTLSKSLSDEQFQGAASVIVRGVKEGSLNTRTINSVKSPRFLQLMTELEQAAFDAMPAPPGGGPQPSRSKAGTPAPVNPTSPAGPTPRRGTASRVKPKQHFIALGPITVPEAYPIALQQHFKELTVIDVQKLPNATFLMLRAILEKSIKAFAEAKGEDIKKTANEKGFVQLHQSLIWLADYFKVHGPKVLLQPAQRIQAGKLANYTVGNDAMNAINHNHNFHVDPDEAFNCWNSMEPLIRELMKP